MAFSSGFFNSRNLDRTYTAENFCDYLGSIICNGILDTYGDCFNLTAASSGLKVTVGRGKAWINGHYFINDARYSIDLSEYMDESLPRYVGIAIYLDTTESVRSVALRLFPGTPAESPQLPSIPQDADHVRLLMYAVRLNPGAESLTERDWFDYREDRNVCGYCRCILGKCRVSELMAEMAQLIAEVQENNTTIQSLTTKVEELTAEVEDIGDVIDAGKCGENVYYVVYSNGKTLVKGSGAMTDYTQSEQSPFYHNDNVKNVVLSEGITTLGERAFMRCETLESIALPTTLTTIGGAAFYQGDYAHGVVYGPATVTIPQSVTEIQRFAFWCNALTEICVPASVQTVGDHVFTDCARLATVRYEGAKIGDTMFSGCDRLTDFTIANTVTEFGNHCFTYCSRLETITYEGTLEQWAAITKGENWDAKSDTGVGNSALTKIQCMDGYLQWDAASSEWVEVRE